MIEPSKQEQYEEYIANTIPQFLSIDSVSDSQLWKTLWLEITDKIFRYYSNVYSKETMQDFGVELLDLFKQCLHSYNRELGVPFMFYLNSTVKKALKHTNKLNEEEAHRGGIHIPDHKARDIRQVISIAQNYGKDIHDEKVQRWIAEQVGKTLEEIKATINLNDRVLVTSEYSQDIEGKTTSIFDNLPSQYKTPEDELLQSEQTNDYFRILFYSVQTIWEGKQERSKPLLSKLLTCEFLTVSESSCGGLFYIEKFSDAYPFFNCELKKTFLSGGKLPSQKKIALEMGTDETNASRMLKKIKKEIDLKVKSLINCHNIGSDEVDTEKTKRSFYDV
jgi:hypothetical protein